MQNFVSPHVHVKSLDSASTPKRFAEREVELGTGHIVVTDHGTLEATRVVYDLCAKGGKYNGKLSPILGLEGYFRDDDDPILLENGYQKDDDGKLVKAIKYAHLTMHALDEAAYFKLVKVLSDADFRAEKHGSERKPLFAWKDLEALGSENMTMTSGCLIGMVGRHLLKNNDAKSAVQYYERLRSTVKPGNFYVEIFPHVTDRFFQSSVIVTLEDGTELSYGASRKFRTESPTDNGEVYAEDLAAAFKKDPSAARKEHRSIVDVMVDRKWSGTQHLNLKSVVHREGFVQNECRPWCTHGDYQLEVNKFLIQLATKYGDPLLISDDSHFAVPEEKIIQDARLGGWRFAESHHRMTSKEAWDYFSLKLGTDRATFDGWVENTHKWADRFRDFKFSPRQALPTKFYPADTLRHTMDLIAKHRRMDWSDPVKVDRLKSEIKLLKPKNGPDLLPYFFVDEEVCTLYRTKGELTGPGRGSAAGLFLANLLGITHIDPLFYNLSRDRFLTPDRVATGKMPDIDQDLPHRDYLVDPNDSTKGWLAERFGSCVAKLSVDQQLKLKNAIKDVHRIRDGYVSDTINAITKKLPTPPQGIETKDYVFGYEVDGSYTPGLLETNTVLQNYIKAYPEHWKVVQGLLGLPRQKGGHPCGFVISSDPIDSFIPMTTVGDTRVTSFTGPSVEAMGGLKMDFLVVNSVRDVGRAIRLIQERYAPHLVPDGQTIQFVQTSNGKEIATVQAIPYKNGIVDVWDLPQERAVYTEIAKGKVETVFQLDGPAARQGLRFFGLKPDGTPPIRDIEGLSAFTALDRPGPLDAYVEDGQGGKHNMLVEFAIRAKGEAGTGRMEILDALCSETHGVIVYQEQLQAIFQQVGGSTGIQANDFRQRIGKKKIVEVRQKDKPLFMKGAVEKLGHDEAERLWSMMETFGQYGFNKSHSVSYMTTAYACAWLKYHFPLEWWTAVLSNADRNDVDEKFWRYVGPMILMPDVGKSHTGFVIEGDKIRAPVWLVHGIGAKAYGLLDKLGPYASLEDLLSKLERYKVDNGTPYVKTDKKGKQVQAIKKAHNPLNDSILRNMTVCGILDSLYPDKDQGGLPLTAADKLMYFDLAAAKVRGKKPKSAAAKFNLTSPTAQYQQIKSIMPAYSVPLLGLIRGHASERFKDYTENVVYYRAKDPKDTNKYGVLTGKQFEWMENLEILPESAMTIALPAYVLTQRVFTYQQNKRACELVLDIDGHRRQFVKWPSKEEGLPPEFRESLEGALVVAMFSRRKPTDDFFFRGIDVVVPPLTTPKEESSTSND